MKQTERIATYRTQGRWSRNIKPARKYSVVFAGRNTHVAAVCSNGLSDIEVEANCDLIVLAPTMHDTLIRLLGMDIPDCARVLIDQTLGEDNGQ